MKKRKKISERPVIQDGDFATASNGQSGNRIFVSVGKTINIGNYESIRVEFGMGKVVPDGENFTKIRDLCMTQAVDGINEMIPVVQQILRA